MRLLRDQPFLLYTPFFLGRLDLVAASLAVLQDFVRLVNL